MTPEQGSKESSDAEIAFEPLKRETLHSRIQAQLEQRLITGKFQPGQKLTLRGLARQLGTSAMPVRDALQHLQSIGALVLQPNGTTSVPHLDSVELQELSEIRLMLESFAAERAITILDEFGRERLRARFEAMCESRTKHGVEDERYLQANWDFHLEIAQLSGLPTLVALLKSIWLRIGPTVQVGQDEHSGRSDALEIHNAICEGILNGDMERTKQALEEDIFYGRPRMQLSCGVATR